MRTKLDLFDELAHCFFENEESQPTAEVIAAHDVHDRLDLALSDEAMAREEYIALLKQVIQYTPKTASKKFFNQLFGGRREEALVGELLAVLMNNSMATYKVAGPQVGIEKALITKSCELAGFDNNSGGTMAAGGSMTNYMSLIMARDKADPQARDKGPQKKLIAYTSADSHYSISKNMSFAGLGRENLRHIDTDDQGRMLTAALEYQISVDLKKGFTPFYVNATAGTTVLGSYDPIAPLVSLCRKHEIWLHVDGAYGGAVMFSNKYKHLLEGLSGADSYCYNAHKRFGVPLSCSIILVNDKKHLHQSFSNDADYLYQTDADDFNLGKISFQCARRNDALKFWTLYKAIGQKGLANIVEEQHRLADVARDYVRSNKNYRLYSFENSISVCFNYKNIAAKTLCTKLYEHGINMVGYGSFRGDTFVRLVTVNSSNRDEDIVAFFKDIEAFVETSM